MTQPETILQFGSGKFLRAFTDLFAHEARKSGQSVGSIVVVQSTRHDRAAVLNAQQGRYHVLIQGLHGSEIVNETHLVESIGRALEADRQWAEVLAAVESPDIRWVVSNTSETGYRLSPQDLLLTDRPASFPARLTHLLYHRYRSSGTPLIILPLELIDDNAAVLKQSVMRIAAGWKLDRHFIDWLDGDICWRHTLVDRITVNPPGNHPLLTEDPLLTLTEPFAFWAIETHPDAPPLFEHPAILHTPDVKRYALRKVRILNGAHTALVCRARPIGFSTVRQAVEDETIRVWLSALIYDEIIPALGDQVDEPEPFAEACMERFRNPFLDHRLDAIAADHDAKVHIRLKPTFDAYVSAFGRPPPLLSQILKS